MPERRSERKPMTRAKSPEISTAKIMAGMASSVSSLKDQTAAYEPTPKKAAWPKLR